MRRVRLDGRLAQGHARRARAGAGARARRPSWTRRSARARSSTSATGRRRRRRRVAVRGAGSTRRSPARSSTRPSCSPIEKEAIGLFISAHPLKEVREALRADGRRPARRRCPERKDGDWVTAGGIITAGEEDPHEEGRPDDVRHPRRPRGVDRGAHLRQGARGVRAATLGVDEVVLVRGRVDHGDKGTSLIAQTVEPLRADARGGRGGARGRRGSCAGGPQPLHGDARRRARCRRRSSTSSSTSSATTPARPRSCSPSTPRPARGRCAWGRATASRRRRACAPSSGASSGPAALQAG